MNSSIEQYLCTTCRSHLFQAKSEHCESNCLNESELICSDCGMNYPVVKGIPRFVPAETYADSFGYQWNIHNKTQLDSFTGLSISRNRLFAVSDWSDHLVGERILEAGSGAGRFTEVLLSTGADIYSFDYSSAVEANHRNNGDKPNLHLFQGDIFNIPLPYEFFDKVFCLGVLQHTPDPGRAFKNLVAYVKPGGEIVIDVYSARLVSLIQWKYLLRPLTKRMNKELLYRSVSLLVPFFLPFTVFMRSILGRMGTRFSPIVEYSDLGLSAELNRDWAILDTFDMYSPAHDHPKSLETVRRWFSEAGFVEVVVKYGSNGITGKGKKTTTENNGGY